MEEEEREKIEMKKKIERQREKKHHAHCIESSIEIKKTKRREQTSPVEYKHIQQFARELITNC